MVRALSMLLLLDLLLSAAVIRIVGGLSKTFEVDDWGPALLAAFFLAAIGFFAPMGLLYEGVFAAAFGPQARRDGASMEMALLLNGALSFVINGLLLTIVGFVTPGITLRGIYGVLLTAVLLTAIELSLPTVLTQVGLMVA